MKPKVGNWNPFDYIISITSNNDLGQTAPIKVKTELHPSENMDYSLAENW